MQTPAGVHSGRSPLRLRDHVWFEQLSSSIDWPLASCGGASKLTHAVFVDLKGNRRAPMVLAITAKLISVFFPLEHYFSTVIHNSCYAHCLTLA